MFQFWSYSALFGATFAVLIAGTASATDEAQPSAESTVSHTASDNNSHANAREHKVYVTEMTGAGGSVFLDYGYGITDHIQTIWWGARFFFLLGEMVRLGAVGAFIRPIQQNTSGNGSGYIAGAVVDVLYRMDPLIIGFPLVIGQASYSNSNYLAIHPQVSAELRVTPEVSVAVFAGYLMLLDTGTFTGTRSLANLSQFSSGIAVTFGAF